MNGKINLCPVCGSSLHFNFFDGGCKPLATLGWPTTLNSALSMERHPLNYVQCSQCTHIWNKDFSYRNVPYTEKPNRMFNAGSHWKNYIYALQAKLAATLPNSPTVIEIGCGEGHFIRGLAKQFNGRGKFVGFDPNGSDESGREIDFVPDYFEAERDIKKFKPDLIIMRHVLEHIEAPKQFVEKIAYWSSCVEKPVFFAAETPCVDKALTTGRIVDFFYEHPSQFTSKSFATLLKSSGKINWVEKGYGEEVIAGVIRLGLSDRVIKQVDLAKKFFERAKIGESTVKEQLYKLSEDQRVIVIWGGTGKAATFMQHYDLTKEKFPVVVDSDKDKIGTFVAGVGQKIKSPSEIQNDDEKIIIIPSQWRAKDIQMEIKKMGLLYCKILIEYRGDLVDFERDNHPYHA